MTVCPSTYVGHGDAASVRAGDGFFTGVVHGHDIRVIEGSSRLRLPAEARLENGVPRQVRAEHLDRDDPRQARVESEMHLGHSAVADKRTHLVAAC